MTPMLEILYEEKSFIVCKKPVGVLSEESKDERESMPDIIARGKNIPKESVFTVHRLDAEVGGVMVYAKSSESAKRLSTLVAERKMEKEYLAVIHGCPEKESDTLKDLLFKDSSKNKSFVVSKMRKGVKEASLEYRLMGTKKTEDGEFSLLRIKLHTGRTHQIRVQFSSRKLPLVGDRRYGSGNDGYKIALWSYRLCFENPYNKGKTVEVQTLPDIAVAPWNLFENELESIDF